MQTQEHQFNELDIRAVLLLKKRVVDEKDIQTYVNEISTYVNSLNYLYIYNMTNQDLTDFYKALKKFNNISYATVEDYGEVENYQMAYEQLIDSGWQYGVVLEQGYYYEEGDFLRLRKYAIEHIDKNIAVITALPLRGCEPFSRSGEEYRECKGCHLTGALVNLDIFNKIGGLKIEYYQSMFDYEYCLRAQKNNYKIILLENCVIRTTNYKIVEKRYFFMKFSSFEYDLMDLYYQTRNRFYLWEEYETINPEYVKLDKKLYKDERYDIKRSDPQYRDKFYMMEEAKYDYIRRITGKYKGGKESEKD